MGGAVRDNGSASHGILPSVRRARRTRAVYRAYHNDDYNDHDDYHNHDYHHNDNNNDHNDNDHNNDDHHNNDDYNNNNNYYDDHHNHTDHGRHATASRPVMGRRRDPLYVESQLQRLHHTASRPQQQ